MNSDTPQAFTRAQIRRVDEVAIQEWSIPGVLLMENAGRGVADVMCEAGIEGKVVVVCAKGNNGGDGFVLARHLNLRGIDCEVVLCSDPDEITGDAAEMFRWLQRCDVPISLLSDCDDESLLAIFREAEWLVDAMLGTGAVGAPRAPLDRVIQAMNATLATRLAIDLPSGLDCDTGEASADTVFANYTCTFVALKTGLLAESAKEYIGELHCLDIGLPWCLVLQAISSGDDAD